MTGVAAAVGCMDVPSGGMEVVTMCAALTLLAVALLGADGAPGRPEPFPNRSFADVVTSVNEAPRPVHFRVKLVEMDGVSWRESLYSKLQPAGRQGTCAVWTCGRDVAKPLAEMASRVVLSPQLLAQPDAVA